MEPDFESIYRENALRVRRYLFSLGCPPQDTEDVVQDAFVKALTHMEDFRGDSSLSVWLCSIAKNTWYDRLKKQKRELPFVCPEHSRPPDRALEWLDLVDKLQEPFHTVFLRRALGDCSYAELARAFGKTESWARVTYHRARLLLQKMLNETEGTP